MVGTFGALWGLAGVFLILGIPICRLTIIAVEAFSYEFLWYHWVVLVLNGLFLAHAEGHRGFQKGFSPRVAARAKYLKDHPNVLYALLGPFFCMGYFCASKRRKVFTISLTVGIIILILLIRLLSQPWQGIIGLGVVIGLVWGFISLLIFSLQAFTSKNFPYSPEVPEGEAS